MVFQAKYLSPSGKKGCPSPTEVLKSKALHIYYSTNTGVLSTEPWVLMGRGRCPQFPSTVDGVGAMTFDCHVGTCPQKGTRAGSNAVLPH